MSGIDKWIQRLKQAEKTCLVQDGKKKVHYTFEDKTEMAEEYNLQTGELLVRKWRKKTTLGAVLPWEFEIGVNTAQNTVKLADQLEMSENSNNPIFSRQDTLNAFQWRIRNLIYPADNYLVEGDDKQRVIIVKTKNKKYYKKFNVPDLDRANMEFNWSMNLQSSFANNTLIITYTKSAEFLSMEKSIRDELSKTTSKAAKDGDVECKPS